MKRSSRCTPIWTDGRFWIRARARKNPRSGPGLRRPGVGITSRPSAGAPRCWLGEVLGENYVVDFLSPGRIFSRDGGEDESCVVRVNAVVGPTTALTRRTLFIIAPMARFILFSCAVWRKLSWCSFAIGRGTHRKLRTLQSGSDERSGCSRFFPPYTVLSGSRQKNR